MNTFPAAVASSDNAGARDSMLQGIIWGTMFSAFSGIIAANINGVIAYVKSLFVTSISIASDVEYFDFLYDFFSKQTIISSTQIHLQRRGTSSLDIFRPEARGGNNTNSRAENFLLSEGTAHTILYKGRILFVTRGRQTASYDRGESITISIPFGSKAFINQMLGSIKKEYCRETNVVQYRTYETYACCWSLRHLPKRSINSVILPKAVKDKVCDDVDWFINSQPWYDSKCLPYHRGYLFAGTPGSGKTSFVMALASHFNMKIYNLPLDKLQENTYSSVLYSIEKNSIVLIEDIDRLSSLAGSTTDKSEEKASTDEKEPAKTPEASIDTLFTALAKKQGSNENSFRNLLQIMDGFQTPTGVIFILTANDPTKINPVLLRSGRIDKRVDFQYADAWQAEQMFLRFFENEPDLAKKFGEQFREFYPTNIPVAQLQEVMFAAVKDNNPLKLFEQYQHREKNEQLT